eukprot:TRINITY_DN4584_c0_g3_i4.p1 TRINITY_DN4584_c0_g3~~TRINITY_DN4584_c0_g3_i4.p1  ORF type:complete len:122 (+),score=21.86 TRINITY_DN4584_c0_g3_i4:162-527(+)
MTMGYRCFRPHSFISQRWVWCLLQAGHKLGPHSLLLAFNIHSELHLTIKNFQPIFSGASLKITVGTILTEINSTTIFDIKNVNIAGDYVFWSNFSIPVAGETVLVEFLLLSMSSVLEKAGL